jgi:hypothetical protein
MCIQENPLSAVPVDPVDFAAYKTSAVGSVATPMETAVDVEDEQRLWFVSPMAEGSRIGEAHAEVSIDPTNRFQGRIVVATGGSSTTDDAKLAGWLSIEYRVRLKYLRPTFDSSIVLKQQTFQSVTGGQTSQYAMKWQELANSVGNWLWESNNATRNTVQPGGQPALTYENSVLTSALDMILDYTIPLGFASVSGTVLDPEYVKVAPSKCVNYPAIVHRRKGWYAMGVVPIGARLRVWDVEKGEMKTGQSVFSVSEGEGEEGKMWRVLELKVPLRGRELRVFNHTSRLEYVPMAAGDVTINVRQQDGTGGGEHLVYSRLFALGTGAITVSDSAVFSTFHLND